MSHSIEMLNVQLNATPDDDITCLTLKDCFSSIQLIAFEWLES